MISGTVVDNLLVGGPAHSCRKLSQGDVILKVDSIEATESNIMDLLVGKDTPGSLITIEIAKGGIQARDLSEIMADYCLDFINADHLNRDPDHRSH
jgi:C-terminal processing protease CtpA/Prc